MSTNKAWYAKYLKRYLRQIFTWSPDRKAAKKRALVPNSNKAIEEYRCELCDKQPLARNAIEIDHILPCDAVKTWDSSGGWGGYIDRLFIPKDGLQILCKPCHKAKSTVENAIRRKNRKDAK